MESSTLQEMCLWNMCSLIKSLPPQIRDQLLEKSKVEIERDAEERVRNSYCINEMRNVLPEIVEDIVLSRTFGTEQTDYIECYPGINKYLLDHVLLTVELTLDAASSCSIDSSVRSSMCSLDTVCSDTDDDTFLPSCPNAAACDVCGNGHDFFNDDY